MSDSTWAGFDKLIAPPANPFDAYSLEDLDHLIDAARCAFAVSSKDSGAVEDTNKAHSQVIFQRLKNDPIRFKSDEEYRRKAPTDDEIASITPNPREFKRRFCPDSTFLDE